jgi:hypothetical protein
LHWIAFGVVLGCVQCGGSDDQAATDEPACAEIIHEAYGEIEGVRARADRACAQDSDCTLFDFDIGCTHGCGQVYAIAASAESTVEAEHGSLEDRYCMQLARPDCARYLGANIPSCGPGFGDPLEAVCWRNKCELCRGGQCLLADELQLCTQIGGELGDCQAL